MKPGATAGPFTFAELQTITSLGRGEVRECVNRGIISAPAGVGQGHHRGYSKWNLVEGVIAAALLQHIRAGSVAALMIRLRLLLQASSIDPERLCKTPGSAAAWHFHLDFPPRTRPDDKAEPPWDEEAGENAFLIATAGRTNPSQENQPATSDNPLAAFCHLPIELEQAVRFVDHMIQTRL